LQLTQSILERVDRWFSATWDLRRRRFHYQCYIVTPRQGRHAVRRRLLRRLMKRLPAQCQQGHAERV
jgi:hypothetical protein